MLQKQTIIEGDIRLEALNLESCEYVRKWRNQTNVAKGFFEQGQITPEDQQLWYQNYSVRNDDHMFIIYFQNSPVGALALCGINFDQKTAVFGRMMIGEEWALGKGIAKQALKMICKYGFEELLLERLYLEVFEDNLSAYKLYEKIGFKKCFAYTINDQIVCTMYYDKDAPQ